MTEDKSILIWVANSYIAEDAIYLRQRIYLHIKASSLIDSWKIEILSEAARRNNTEPDFTKATDISVFLYHVRQSSILNEDESIESQGIKDGDVFILLNCEDRSLEQIIKYLRLQFFPERVIGLQDEKSVTLHQIIEANKKNVNQKQHKIKILFLSSDPVNVQHLRVGEELDVIQETLRKAGLREYFDLQIKLATCPENIIDSLLTFRPSIVHFTGHGSPRGEIYLEDSKTKEFKQVSPEALSKLFELFAEEVNCVILNACYSEQQADAISKHIRYVIGMSREVGEGTARAFVLGLYQALGEGCDIQNAFKFGEAEAMLMEEISAIQLPFVLKLKKGLSDA